MPLAIDLIDRIEELFEDTPDKRKKKEYQEWKDTINIVIKELNILCKFKVYNEIK
jgi:hypothetical protein